jgi:hypothetical protein
MQWISPDVAVMQEMISQQAVNMMRDSVFLRLNDDWVSEPFINGPDTDNALFYRTSKVIFVSQRAIHTQLRDITEYVIQPLSLDSTEQLRLYSAHLKASEGTENEERRRQECLILRAQLDLLPQGSLFMMMGDFNLYTSDESAYQLLLSPDPNPNGQLFDPIDSPGDWNNNSSFAPIHTQSTRTTDIGDGGATGGLDDRFDFILISGALIDTIDSRVLPQTYHAVGNDGNHFNQSINEGSNSAVPDSVADALHFASDHLPVVTDFLLARFQSALVHSPTVASEFSLLNCYPNPFNSTLSIELGSLNEPSNLAAFDVLGRRIFSRDIRAGSVASSTLRIDFSPFAAGCYFIRLDSKTFSEARKVQFIR